MSLVRTILTSSAVALASVAVLAAAPWAVADDSHGPLRADLSGANETPVLGDLDGTGTAKVRIKLGKDQPGKAQLCYQLKVSGIEPATAAHIHEAPAGKAGPVVVGLEAPADGKTKGCVTVSSELAMEILADPADYYVNVHNRPFPGGALRGQLG